MLAIFWRAVMDASQSKTGYGVKIRIGKFETSMGR
jgi:hypothetical protein